MSIKNYLKDLHSNSTIGPHYVEEKMFSSNDNEQESKTATKKKGGIVVNFKEFLARHKSQKENSASQMSNGATTIDSGDSSRHVYKRVVKKIERGGKVYFVATLE